CTTADYFGTAYVPFDEYFDLW
nr:immunoglobulin heavy chain junction region [Macaca mulatta]